MLEFGHRFELCSFLEVPNLPTLHWSDSVGCEGGGGHAQNVRNNLSTNVGAEKIILGNSRNKVSFNKGHQKNASGYYI
jgi:hypothetical protein